jgi:two-component system, NtrC family, nitrogen regulation sensor histidine kinase NtrY
LKRFTVLVVIRIVLLLSNMLLMAWIFGDMRLIFNQIILFIILIVQITELIHFVNHTNRELARLFMAIRHADFSISFKEQSLKGSFKDLQYSFSEIIKAYKEVKIEKEIQYQFLQMLVNQIQIGILSLQNEEITMINPTAQKLLNLEGTRNWKLFEQLHPALTNEINQLGDHGRKLVEVRSTTLTKFIAVHVNTLVILDKPHKLITLQDINSEIEQKEIEAWHKLIRILTHEIMNSVTPIASLTETMHGMLTDKEGKQKALHTIHDETIADILFSLHTIHKRSEGLLNFVENYRKLTRVPTPVKERVSVNDLLTGIEGLMKPELVKQGIRLTVTSAHELQANMDPKLIEQVIINLITNSVHAVEGRPEKNISVSAWEQDQHAVIEVKDTGKGITEKQLREIFIPFFSTKKNGSGIGLSLSKQIMSLHGGTIKVQSRPNEGSTFLLSLPI